MRSEKDANNEVVITFMTRVAPKVSRVMNQGCAQWDENGNPLAALGETLSSEYAFPAVSGTAFAAKPKPGQKMVCTSNRRLDERFGAASSCPGAERVGHDILCRICRLGGALYLKKAEAWEIPIAFLDA